MADRVRLTGLGGPDGKAGLKNRLAGVRRWQIWCEGFSFLRIFSFLRVLPSYLPIRGGGGRSGST